MYIYTPLLTAPHPPRTSLGQEASGTHQLPSVGDPVAAQATMARDHIQDNLAAQP